MVNKRPVSNQAVRANLERERAQKPKAPLIVASHPDADTNSLVTVLDAANIVGIDNISVATTN
jgi:biopolymer transport protein ExbD